MKKFILPLVFAASTALAAFDFVDLSAGATATNVAAGYATNLFPVSAKAVSIQFTATANSTGTVSTVSGIGSSKYAAKTIAGPIVVAAGSLTTNLALPTPLAGDKLVSAVSSAAYVINTSKVVVVLEQ